MSVGANSTSRYDLRVAVANPDNGRKAEFPRRDTSLQVLSTRPSGIHRHGVTAETLEQFCDRHGRTVTAHAHADCVQLIIVGSGRGYFEVDGAGYPFGASATLIVPAQAVHGFDFAVDATGWVISLSTGLLHQLAARAGELLEIWDVAGVIDFDDCPDEFAHVLGWSRRISLEESSTEIGGSVAREAYLSALLIAVLRRSRKNPPGASTGLKGASGLLRRYLELVDAHFHERLAIDEYCGLLKVTRTQLRSACGAQRPIAILHDRIMAEARRLLAYTRMSVSEISYALGFEDPSYFVRFFKKNTGLPPSQYRTNM